MGAPTTGGWAIVMLTLSALLAVAGGSAAGKDDLDMRPDAPFTDFATLQPPDSPNTWLVAPAGFTRATPDETAPEFPVDAPRLAELWQKVVTAEPRTTIAGISPDGLQLEAQQRTAVFGFIDDISFRAIPATAGHATLAVYSRARVGYWDLGVNQRRVRAWLDRLQRLVAHSPSPAP